MKTDLALPIDRIAKFCQHWQIIELSLFGSILRDDFHADSDINILVAPPQPTGVYSIAPKCNQNSKQSSADQSLSSVNGRSSAVPTGFATFEILSTAQTIYVK